MPRNRAAKGKVVCKLLQCLAMLGNIQPFQLLLLRNPERHESTDELEQDESEPGGPDQRDGYSVELQQYLPRDALDQARRTADRGGGEHAGEQRAGDAADAVDAEHVERIVIAETL